MKTVLYIIVSCFVVALAFWAYRENYTTQVALKETQTLRTQIQGAHARLAVLKAEWAYLNRPDRLQELADLNFDKLQLLTLRPDQFGLVDQVAYPASPEPFLDIRNSVEVSSDTAGDRP